MNVVGDGAIDIADEAQRHVIVLCIDPARAGKATAHHAQLTRERLREFETREETRHGLVGEPRMSDAPRRHRSGDAYLPGGASTVAGASGGAAAVRSILAAVRSCRIRSLCAF